MKMKKFSILLLITFVLLSCQNSTKSDQFSTIDHPDDELVNVITINSQGDTLTQFFNYTRKTVVINFKGKKLTLKQDTTISCIRFSNKKYVLEINEGETILSKKDEVVFRFTKIGF